MLAFQNQQMTPQETAALVAAMMTVVGIFLLIGLAIAIVVCAILYSAQKRVPVEHRKIEPLMIWLLLIPLFNIVWNFFVYLRIPESYQSYFHSQGRTDVGDCGRGIGLWLSICYLATIIPCVNYIAGPAALVLLIIFLVKITGLKNQLPPAPAM
jgi:hypothetical protein